MKNNYFGAIFLFSIITISGQQVKWQKDIKSDTQDFLSQLSVTIDGQYLISGSSINTKNNSLSTEGSSGNNGYDYHLLKLNQDGDTVWEKYYGGTSHDYLTASTSTQEGGFLLAGTSYSSTGGDKTEDNTGSSDVWLIKITEDGNEEWQKTIGGSYSEEARAVVQTDDLQYIIASDLNTGTGGERGFGSKDIWLVRLDKSGTPILETIIGGKGLDEIEKMIPTEDGGCLIAVYSRSGQSDDITLESENVSVLNEIKTDSETSSPTTSINSGNNTTPAKSTTNKKSYKNITTEVYAKTSENYGEGDYWIIKVDKELQVEWQKNYGGSGDDHIRNIRRTDTGYIISGESVSSSSGNKQTTAKEGSDLWLLSLDKEGNELWQNEYSFGNRDVVMSSDVIWDKEGITTEGILLGGYTQAEEKAEKNDETFWLLYIDKDGNEEWRKYVEGESKKQEERLIAAQLVGDGSYVLAGTSAKALGEENWKIVKLGEEEVETLIQKKDIRIYPNPVENYCYVELGKLTGETQISLYDMSGKLVQSTKTKNQITKLNTSSLPQGVYIVTAATGNKSLNAKIIKK